MRELLRDAERNVLQLSSSLSSPQSSWRSHTNPPYTQRPFEQRK